MDTTTTNNSGSAAPTGESNPGPAPVIDPQEEQHRAMLRANLGTRRVAALRDANFPDADEIVQKRAIARKRESSVDVMLVNPPAPDGGLWIRTQYRVGRRTRENMVWPQVSLAQLGALLVPDYSICISDAMSERMSWANFEALLKEKRPRYYLTQVTAPTLTNDMYGVFLAKSLGAVTIAFGTHVTPTARETLRSFPALDYVLRGEPELTLRELIDTLDAVAGRWTVTDGGRLINPATQEPLAGHKITWKMWSEDPTWKPAWLYPGLSEPEPVEVSTPLPVLNGTASKAARSALPLLPKPPMSIADHPLPSPAQLGAIRGLGWRNGDQLMINWDRQFFKNMDDLPMPLYHLLPLDRYRMPMIKGSFAFMVTSRGCPAGCKYCIKHVTFQNTVRLRSPKLLVEEAKLLKSLGIAQIHMYADLFTVNREQVMEFCELMIQEKINLPWTCNSRVDYVDREMLLLMGKAGCDLISWGIESGNEMVLKKAHKGYKMQQAHDALKWAKEAGIKNWGYFIIGLPGETVSSIQDTMKLSKSLPLDIALFHVAAPYPGTPFFFEVVENNWFRADTNWEEVDMDQATVLDYGDLKAEDLLYWQKRAFREWAFRPGPVWTMIKSMNTWAGLKSALNIGWQTLGWVK